MAIAACLDRYGMRCIGEIDITRPRWHEDPTALLQLLVADIDRFTPGESERMTSRGRQAAKAKATEVLSRVARLPGGAEKAAETNAAIARLRTFIGYREFPKYEMVCRYDVYRRALLCEAERLVGRGALAPP